MRVRWAGRRRLTLAGGSVLLAVSCALLAGCGVGTAALRQTQAITITAPAGTGIKELPVAVRWASTYPAGTEFVLFLDQAPIPPDQELRYVPQLLHDTSCLIQPSCPDASYLNNLNIYTTTKTSFVFSTLPISANRDPVTLHELTIVALGSDGRRIGEVSATVSFRIPTADTGL